MSLVVINFFPSNSKLPFKTSNLNGTPRQQMDLGGAALAEVGEGGTRGGPRASAGQHRPLWDTRSLRNLPKPKAP